VAANERHLDFEACFNFRDLGGYAAEDGRTVAWGRVYRSDMFHRMTEADRARLRDLGLRTVIDLRSTNEVERWGRFDHHEVDYHHHPLFEEGTTALPPITGPDHPEPENPAEMYLLFADEGALSLARALTVLAEGDHPAVFHCAAGKDRTGVLAALLLLALGVPEDVVVDDYQLTELAVARQAEWLVRHEPESAAEMDRMPGWIRASRPYVMRAFLDGLRADHGSPEGYLSDIGIDQAVITTLQERLLV
jgi:protein-tyrosine phosphatase